MGTVDRLLAEHVSFRLTGVDRIGVAGYIRGLAYEGGVIKFLLGRGYYIPSPAGLGHNHDRLRDDIDAFVEGAGLEVVRFAKGETKEDRARPYQDAAESAGAPGVVLVGKAQEKMAAWTGYKDKASPLGSDGHPLAWALADDDLRVEHSYFEELEPYVDDVDATYTDGEGRLRNTRAYEWNHSIGEVVTAVLDHGLRVVTLTEHDWTVWPRFPWLVETGDHRWATPPDRPRVPLTFTLLAARPP